MEFLPTGNRLLLRAIKPVESETGLVLPEQMSGRAAEGEVVAIGLGEGKETCPVRVMQPGGLKIGARVLYKPYAVDKVKISGEELLVVGVENVLGILK